ncbi:MAG TPA: septal ring lytic transglycosylase RlpA family protein [Solirubrobacteraceae bacterium]|nr:septal ring lytic transglycosylase RlpA family protein [Solirubrobacteraceae bacterium]
MRPKNTRAGVAAGVIGIATTCVAAPALAQSESPSTTPSLRVSDRTLTIGKSARFSGAVDPAYAGRAVALEFRRTRGTTWTVLATDTVGREGRYRIRRSVPRSGAVRVVLQPQPGTATAASAPSAERRIRVAAAVRVRHRRLHVRAGRRTAVAGIVRPGSAGVPVRLQVRGRRGWATIDRDRTNRRGRYVLRERLRSTRSTRARVVVAGHDGLARARRGVGRLNVYRYAHASWYGPGLYGNRLGCGGTLHPGTLGVAHKTLPCGTKVTFRHRGRTIRVRVIDRGPYVGGREYDLTQATANRLGFRGHGPVLVTR